MHFKLHGELTLTALNVFKLYYKSIKHGEPRSQEIDIDLF